VGRVLSEMPEWTTAVQRLEQAGQWQRGSLSRQAVDRLYGQKVPMSASRMDKYKSCHFSYFMRYGLKAEPRRRAGFDAPEYGTFVHYVLEQVFKSDAWRDGEGGVNRDKLKALTRAAVEDYVQNELGGLEQQSARFVYLFRRLMDGVDAVVIGTQVISALQSIVSRNVGPQESAVLTIGTVQAGTRYNIIPETCTMEGTCRTLNPEIQNELPKRMENITAGIVRGMGGSYTFSYTKGFSPIMNDPEQTTQMIDAATVLLGSDNVVLQDKATMIGEDFSFYGQKVPAVFYWLGCRQTGASFYPLHSSHFCPDETAMRTGIYVMLGAVITMLA